MTFEQPQLPIVLVLEDVDETRYLIEKMLVGSGYCVALARNEDDAIVMARSHTPDLILMSLGLGTDRLIAAAHRIRQQAALSEEVGVVIFYVPTIPEGAEMEVDKNVYLTRPDNFNQVRDLLQRLLCKASCR
ncbi:response regulator [Edaphobacter bradus]|uniref:response regulator n=1 Tax=Edaphobacter bradus TaxID=2259016 RepID=UPI0021DF6FD9|nr:hypothetical protein [Edaphobacter bradus]